MRIVYPRLRLRELAERRGASLAALSDMIGRPRRYLDTFVREGRPTALGADDRHLLAAFFGVPEVELGGDAPHWAERRARRAA